MVCVGFLCMWFGLLLKCSFCCSYFVIVVGVFGIGLGSVICIFLICGLLVEIFSGGV